MPPSQPGETMAATRMTSNQDTTPTDTTTSSDIAHQDNPPDRDESAAPGRPGRKLTETSKRFLLRELAAHTPHKEIRALIQKDFEITISLATISWYRQNPNYRETIQNERDSLAGAIQEIPISSVYWRLRERQKLYKLAIDRDKNGRRNPALALSILESAAKDIGSIQAETDPTRPAGQINLKVIAQVLALPAPAVLDYIRTGRLDPTSYLVDVDLPVARLPAAQPEAETSTESDERPTTDSKASVCPGDGLTGQDRR